MPRSHFLFAANAGSIPRNALICTTAQFNRPPKKNEIILDESDGLDWKTAVRCDVIYLLPKAEFTGHRGQVSLPR